MGIKRKVLIEQAASLIKTYNPKRTTLESHAAEFLASIKAEGESAFLKEVLYGVMRCKAALRVFMACFFNDMSARVLRSDYTMYMILTYLSIFRLKELTIREYRKFVLSIDPDKMINFLEYIFSPSTLESSGVIADWTKTFDPDYVRDTLLADLTMARPEIQIIINELHEKSMGLVAAKQKSEEQSFTSGFQKVTTKSPNLTLPAPRHVPEPQTIKQAKIKQPVRAEYLEVETRRRKMPKEAIRPKRTCLSPTLHQTRSRPQVVRGELEMQIARGLEFNTCTRGKATGNSNATVKLNAATILREDALFRNRQDLEATKIDAYEAELRDSSNFHQWQTEMRARDQKIRLEQIVRTRILAKASAADAQKAKLSKLIGNRQLAACSVEETIAMQKQRSLELEMSWLRKRGLVNEVKQKRKTAPRRAIEAMSKVKCGIRERIQRDMGARLRRRQIADATRTRKLSEHVKQLKAEHGVHRDHTNVFDPTDTTGLGLLDEMSLVEMQERLLKNQKRHGERLEDKRLLLDAARDAKNVRLAERTANIHKIRGIAAFKNFQTRCSRHEQELTLNKSSERDHGYLLLKLVDDLAEKQKTWHQQELGGERRTRKDQFSAGCGDRVMERHTLGELLRGAERMAKIKQRRSLQAIGQNDAVKLKEERQMDLARATKETAQQKEHMWTEELLRKATLDMMQNQKSDIAQKKRESSAQRQLHREIMSNIIDPYTEHVNLTSVIRARRHASHKHETRRDS